MNTQEELELAFREYREGTFIKALGVGDKRPDLIVRFGRGKGMPKSLRRPLESVLI
jgi:hypothetical protein